MAKKKTLKVETKSLDEIIQERIDNLDDLFDEFLEKYKKVKVDKFGNVEDATNPYLVSTYFFKTLNPCIDVEPTYTTAQIIKIWELYKEIIERINMELSLFQPTLSHFASFLGVSLDTLHMMRANKLDDSMRTIMEKIFTETFDANITLSQRKLVTERATTYRMKVENEAIEKKSPTLNINVGAKAIDLTAMNERLAQIQEITRKQIDYEGK